MGPEAELGLGSGSGFSLKLESRNSLGPGSGPSAPGSRGESNHGAQHTLWLSVPAVPGSPQSIPHHWAPTFPGVCTPSWPGSKDPRVHLSAELSWEPSSANGPKPVSLRSLPPDCWRSRLCLAASELGSHCRVQTPSTAQFQPSTKHSPDGQGPPCLPASCLRHCSLPARGPGEVPTPQLTAQGQAGQGKGRAHSII